MLSLVAFFAARPGLVLGIFAAAALAALIGSIYLHGVHRGAEGARTEIRTKDERAGAAGQDAFTDVETCIYAGREWDDSKGVCR